MKLTLDGLTIAPAQVWGNVRLVPLLREEPLVDLRLALRDYGEGPGVVQLDPRTIYTGYVPHGLVVSWGAEGEAIPAVDTQLGRSEKRKGGVIALTRMARSDGPRRLRFLPLHLAMEGFLGLHFGGPDFADRFWSRQALRQGMDPRTEQVIHGGDLPGLAEALAVFERHRNQAGLLIFIGDHLASVTLVGHPDDYKALHEALLTDFYGVMFAQHGWAFREVSPFEVQLEGTTFAAIRASLQRARSDWAAFALQMAAGLFPRDIEPVHVRRAGGYELIRFATRFDLSQATRDGEHIGEAIVREGRLAYLKTYRLDRGQIRRGYLLSELARHDWDPAALAASQGHRSVSRIAADLEAAGLGWMTRVPA